MIKYIKDFLKYKKWVIRWHKFLKINIPSTWDIWFKYLTNDLYRYIRCKFILYNRLVDNNNKLLKENEELNELIKHLYEKESKRIKRD